MGVEIERKFLVRTEQLPAQLPAGRAFLQGYLAHSPSVRVRVASGGGEAETAFLTIKGPGLLERAEFEYEIPASDGHALLGICVAQLTKVRYRVAHGAHTWDLDRFTGAHDGLWLAEVELSSADAAFERPAWLGDEVTEDPRYTNGALARAGRAP